MSPNLRDLLHQLADHETAAATAAAPDTRTEVRHVMTDIRSIRTRRVAVVGAAAVTVLAVGVAAATALSPAPRDPAVVDPAPSATASPTPSPSTSATPTAAAADEPVRWGVADSLASAPRPLWTRTADSVRPSSGSGAYGAMFVDVLTGSPFGDVVMISAGDVLVASVPVEDGTYALTGLDAATGTVLWVDDTDEGGRTSGVCGGVTTEGLLVCRARMTGEASGADLVDPADGSVVRTFPFAFATDSLGVAGDVIVAHGTVDGTSARWDGLDASTGATLWSHTEPGAASDAETGAELWTHTSTYVHLVGVVGDGALLRDYDDGALTFVDLATGEVRWTAGDTEVFATDGERVLTHPTEGSGVAALSLADGTVVWSLDETRGAGAGSQVDPRHLLLGSEGTAHLYAW